MIGKIRQLALSAIIALVLASCNLKSPTTGDNPSLLIQSTAVLSQLVTITLTVQADTSVPFNAVGQSIKFNYGIKNTGSTGVSGNVTVSGATVTCPGINTIGNFDNSLDPNETLTCTSSYSITQADLDRGSVAIGAMANVNGINSNPVTTTVPLVQSKALTLTSTANPSTYDQVGRQITLTYIIKNSGALSLGPAQFTVSDSLIGTTPINCGNADTTLAPNATVTCTAIYTVTQADLNSVSVTNVATASGAGAGPSQSASTTINKSNVVQSNPANLTPGNPIQYTVIAGDWLWQIARCNGVDPNKLATDNRNQIPNPGQISPGTILTVNNPGIYSKYYGPPCVAVYTVQSSDTWDSIAQKYNADLLVLKKANSSVLSTRLVIPCNSAGGTAAPCNSVGGPTSPPVQSKALTLTTTANPVTYDQVGQPITFTYIIKNSGNASLGPAQFTVSDSLISSAAFNCGNANTSLAPNATVSCSAIYTITQADLNSVSVTNIATASGGGAGPSAVASTTVNKGVKALTLTTTANPLTYDQVGQPITFTYVIKNSGSANLGPTQFTVSDSLISSAPFNCGVANTTLAPNATATCSAIYTITQADLSAVSITNIATTSGGGVGPSSAASVTVNKVIKLLTLTTTANSLTYSQAGQQITFTYVIKNGGNTTLGPTQFTVSDSLIGAAPFNCGNSNTSLAPNATVTCTAIYTITQADLNSVSVTNIATASGGGAGPSQAASTTVNKQ